METVTPEGLPVLLTTPVPPQQDARARSVAFGVGDRPPDRRAGESWALHLGRGAVLATGDVQQSRVHGQAGRAAQAGDVVCCACDLEKGELRAIAQEELEREEREQARIEEEKRKAREEEEKREEEERKAELL